MDSPQPSSATSPIEQQTLSPLVSAHTNDSKESKKEGSSSSLLMNFNDPPSGGSGGEFKHSVFNSDTGGTPLSEANLSPTGTGQFTFSPDPNVGGFLSSEQARQFGPGGPNFQRPRSQTFPTLDLEFMNQTETNASNEPETPNFPPDHLGIPCTMPSPALGSPAHEFAASGPFGIDNAMSPRHQRSRRGLRHSSSASSLQGRSGQHQQTAGSTTPNLGSTTLSPVISSPTPPSQEDAQRAANTLLSFIANSGPNSLIDQTDYNAVIRLTEKLMLHQQAQQAAARSQANMSMGPPVLSGLGVSMAMGGLDRIPEGDAEMGDGGHQMESQTGMIKSEEPMAV
ncbi:hypothetical protein BD289DRAFT_176579 [Coniella lustricola]|uniref:Uncharacterized protein n=1 Tax=Coniella lustricola TaxID=2025994 RepID=A0A2T2ZTJ8_9PEZI|nr:hypothetical protein BD289DRAFT_176579 [Coniella lustricola]